VHPRRVPVIAFHQFLLLHFRPAVDPIHLRARQAVAGGVVPPYHHRAGADPALRGFAQQVAVVAPAGGAGDDHIRAVLLEQVAVDVGGVALLAIDHGAAHALRAAHHADHALHQGHQQLALAHRFGVHLTDVAGERLQVDALRRTHPAQEVEPPLRAGVVLFGVLAALLQAQAFHRQPRLAKAAGDLFFQAVIGQQHHFHAVLQQGRHNIALQEVDNCQAVIGADKHAFCLRHEWVLLQS